ncbi:MAG: imidazole glycerol phosphate synthase subunit HisH [Pelagimonas sp.]|jgi:glutamine amidotransferase|nr:imidazole glycerol phosphate synthase subunit HisH [Pelagimonas sp.]
MATPTCAVIDYGIGNVFSVLHALERIDCPATLTADRAAIMAADRVILPGVGAFGRAAEKLASLGLDEVLHDYIATGKPLMGICVGMQLLLETGEEFGSHQGLGVIPGKVSKIAAQMEDGSAARVPFIGWANVTPPRDDTHWDGTPFESTRAANTFYFVHSYHAQLTNPEHVLGTHTLGNAQLTSAIRKDNVMGVQFHPERSAWTGQRFLKGFMENGL